MKSFPLLAALIGTACLAMPTASPIGNPKNKRAVKEIDLSKILSPDTVKNETLPHVIDTKDYLILKPFNNDRLELPSSAVVFLHSESKSHSDYVSLWEDIQTRVQNTTRLWVSFPKTFFIDSRYSINWGWTIGGDLANAAFIMAKEGFDLSDASSQVFIGGHEWGAVQAIDAQNVNLIRQTPVASFWFPDRSVSCKSFIAWDAPLDVTKIDKPLLNIVRAIQKGSVSDMVLDAGRGKNKYVVLLSKSSPSAFTTIETDEIAGITAAFIIDQLSEESYVERLVLEQYVNSTRQEVATWF